MTEKIKPSSKERGKKLKVLPIDYSGVRVRLLRFAAGTELPKHSHHKPALHIVTKGKLQLEDGRAIEANTETWYYVRVGLDYRGRAEVDTEIVVVEPNE